MLIKDVMSVFDPKQTFNFYSEGNQLMYFWLTPVAVGLALSLVRFYSKRSQDSINTDNRFFMSRVLSYIMLVVALASFCAAVSVYLPNSGHTKSDANPGLIITAASILCALVWNLYEVRLETSTLRFGLMARRSLSYDQIARIIEVCNEKSPRAILITLDGKRVGIWSNLNGFDTLIDRLVDKCPSARHERLDKPGQRMSKV
jgi:hypothetical protein